MTTTVDTLFGEVFFRVEGVRHPEDTETHIERINRTVNPAYIPGLDYVPPAGKGRYESDPMR